MTDVIRRALAVYETLINVSSEKHEIIIRAADGRERTLLLVP